MFLVSWLFIYAPASANTVSSQDLINNAPLYNGKIVAYEGEVIGDVMDQWINVNDGNAAIGIFYPDAEMVKSIKLCGGYNAIGDRVLISGRFNQACPDHGGDLDIHAQKIEVAAAGTAIKRDIKSAHIYSLLILILTASIIYMLKLISDKT